MKIEDKRYPSDIASERSQSEDGKAYDAARKRTRPECQNGKLGVRALKSAERVRSGNYFRCEAAMPIIIRSQIFHFRANINNIQHKLGSCVRQAKLVSIQVLPAPDGDAFFDQAR